MRRKATLDLDWTHHSERRDSKLVPEEGAVVCQVVDVEARVELEHRSSDKVTGAASCRKVTHNVRHFYH